MTEFTLGARASCSDGFCGEVIRTILDPATRVVTHLVIEPKHRKMDGRLVPLELVDATGDEIRLRCNLARFEQLEPAEEVDLAGGVDYSGGYGSVAGMEPAWESAWARARDADRPQSRRPAGRHRSRTP